MARTLRRQDVLGFRVRAQQLDRETGTVANTAILDIGVQDTGPDGALWALALRGVDVSKLPGRQLAMAWTIRGAPHFYRRKDLPAVARAVEPFSDADAGKRIFDAAKPLKAAGIGNLEALDAVATKMRAIVNKPMAKGEVSTLLTAAMDEPYLRYCRPCQATHLYEMPFRLAALRAGLELQPGTSPPVLERIPGFSKPAKSPGRHQVIRAYLRLLGPATPKHVGDYLDAPVKEVQAHWPREAVEVSVEGETRWVMGEDLDALSAERPRTTLLLGPFDLYLQLKDRRLLVEEPAKQKALWPVLGRPGGVLVDGEIAGIWRPRKSGAKFSIQVELWRKVTGSTRRAIHDEAERLAAYRGVSLTGLELVS